MHSGQPCLPMRGLRCTASSRQPGRIWILRAQEICGVMDQECRWKMRFAMRWSPPGIRSGRQLCESSGVNQTPDRCDSIDAQITSVAVLTDHRFIGSIVDAIDLIVSDEALDPLNLGSELSEHFKRLHRSLSNIGFRKVQWV